MNKESRYDQYSEAQDLYRLMSEGFFSDILFGEDFVTPDGKLRFDKLQELFTMFDGCKYQMKYYLVHHNIVPTRGVANAPKSAEAREAMYRDCLKQDITWEEYLGGTGDDEGRLY